MSKKYTAYNEEAEDWSNGRPRNKTSKPGKKHNKGNEYDNFMGAYTPKKKEVKKTKQPYKSHADINEDD